MLTVNSIKIFIFKVVENCPVSKIHTGLSRIGGHPQVQAVITPFGAIKTNCVVNCSGK